MFFVFNRSDGITTPILYFPLYSRPNTAKFDTELDKTPSTTQIGQQIPILRTSSLIGGFPLNKLRLTMIITLI